MRALDAINLKEHQLQAVLEADRVLKDRFFVTRTIIFGSAARDEATDDSDLDLLVITDEPVTPEVRAEISRQVFSINLKHDTLISTVVVDADAWNDGIMSGTQLRNEVERDGVRV